MDYHPGVAVVIADKVVDHKVAHDLFHIHHGRDIFPFVESFQRPDQPGFILVSYRSLGVFKDIGIAAERVVSINEFHIVGTHAPHTTALAGVKFFHSLRQFSLGHGWGHFLLIPVVRTLDVPLGDTLFCLGLGRVCLAVLSRFLSVGGRQMRKVEVCRQFNVPPDFPATHAHDAVRFVKFPGAIAVVALQEALLYSFHRQVEPPFLSVDGDIRIAAQRRVHSELLHHPITQIILHVSVILNNVVQIQLIQSLILDAILIMVKFQFKTVPIVAIVFDLGQGGISFGADSHIPDCLAVDGHIAHDVFLILAVLQKTFPVIHGNLNGVDLVGTEETGLIFFFHPSPFATGSHSGKKDQNPSQNRQDYQKCNAINVLVG